MRREYLIGQTDPEDYVSFNDPEPGEVEGGESLSPEKEVRQLRLKHRTLRYNFFTVCWLYFFVLLLLFVFIWGVLIYVFVHGHDDLDEDIKDLNMRLDNLNLTGLDDLDPAGLCTLLEDNVPINCLSDVTGTGGTDGDILTLDSGEWMPMDPDTICPASCINGTDGAQGPPGVDGTDGVNGTDGINCWDLNENGVCDLVEEDINDDGVCNVTDCQSASGTNGTQGPQGPPGETGPEGPPGPILPLCEFNDTECQGIPLDCSVLKYDSNSSTWNSTILAYSDLAGDLCSELGDKSLDCLSDVDTTGADPGDSLGFNGVNWVPQATDFDGFVDDVCNGDFFNFTLDCMFDVNTDGASDGDVLRFDGSNWVDAQVDYEDLTGSPEETSLKGIGGGIQFSNYEDQTSVLVPSVMGTVDFTGGAAYAEINATTNDLNGIAMFTFNGLNGTAYFYNVFYYNTGIGNSAVNFYQYTTTQMNTGSVAGTLVGSFTTSISPGYGVSLLTLTITTDDPCVIIPQTTGTVYIKAIM